MSFVNCKKKQKTYFFCFLEASRGGTVLFFTLTNLWPTSPCLFVLTYLFITVWVCLCVCVIRLSTPAAESVCVWECVWIWSEEKWLLLLPWYRNGPCVCRCFDPHFRKHAERFDPRRGQINHRSEKRASCFHGDLGGEKKDSIHINSAKLSTRACMML